MKKKTKETRKTKRAGRKLNKTFDQINNHPLFTILFFMIATALIGSFLVILLIPHF